jgi:hypothetical protein
VTDARLLREACLTRAKRIEGRGKVILEKNAVRIGGRIVSMTDAQVRDLVAKTTGKRKPKLKRAADRAWEKKGRG